MGLPARNYFCTILGEIETSNILENHISDARCFAKFRYMVSEVERMKCVNFCQMLVTKHDDNICSFTSFFTGGCRDACADDDYGDKHNPFLSVYL